MAGVVRDVRASASEGESWGLLVFVAAVRSGGGGVLRIVGSGLE